VSARFADGSQSVAWHPLAVCWCLDGARERLVTSPVARLSSDLAIGLMGRVGAGGTADSIVVWNDMPGRTHADVLALFDRAIEFCGQCRI
jgi:hypothetical protein